MQTGTATGTGYGYREAVIDALVCEVCPGTVKRLVLWRNTMVPSLRLSGLPLG